MSTCRHCDQNADFLRKKHGQCHGLQTTDIQEMAQLITQATSAHSFKEAHFR